MPGVEGLVNPGPQEVVGTGLRTDHGPHHVHVEDQPAVGVLPAGPALADGPDVDSQHGTARHRREAPEWRRGSEPVYGTAWNRRGAIRGSDPYVRAADGPSWRCGAR